MTATFTIHLRETVVKTLTVNANNVLDAKHLFLEGAATHKGEEVLETLAFVIEAPDGKRYDADFIGLARDIVEEIDPVDLRPLTGALTGLKENVAAAARRVPIEEEIRAVEKAMALLGGVVSEWPHFDTDEPVNGGDAVEYLEALRSRAIVILDQAGIGTSKLRPEKPHDPDANVTMPTGFEFRASEITDLPPAYGGCTCSCHSMPGVMHMDACCYPTKSDIARRAADKSGLPVIDYRAPLTEPVDLRGLPAIGTAPLAFEYYEVRPCMEHGGGVDSFRSEEDRDAAFNELSLNEKKGARQFWTLYGMAPEAHAIGDFLAKEDAMQIMNAILAPMAKARDALDAGFVFQFDRDGARDKIREASAVLDDVINQSSNAERI